MHARFASIRCSIAVAERVCNPMVVDDAVVGRSIHRSVERSAVGASLRRQLLNHWSLGVTAAHSFVQLSLGCVDKDGACAVHTHDLLNGVGCVAVRCAREQLDTCEF